MKLNLEAGMVCTVGGLLLASLVGCGCNKPSTPEPAAGPTSPPVVAPPPVPLESCNSTESRAAVARDIKQLETKIVGGKESDQGAHGFMAAISSDGKHQYCGGALIAKDWVLTAAHCQVRQTDKVILGRQDLDSSAGKVVSIVRVKNHGFYNSQTHDFDVALLQIQGAPDGLPVLEPYQGSDSFADKDATVIGWGYTQEGGPLSAKLREVTVPIVSNATCIAGYQPDGVGISDNMLCAGLKAGGKDSCQGDSGGPIVVSTGGRLVQTGVVSFGIGCAQPNRYGVYTRLSKFSSWLRACMR